MSDIEIRTIDADEYIRFAQVLANALGFSRTPEQVERSRPMADYERSFAAFDGGDIVGITRFNGLDLSLPGGGTTACAGCTGVGILPTHRRRGLMTVLMRSGLDQAHERGEPFAALYASESPIYPRFGFGPAIEAVGLEMPRVWTQLAAPPVTDGVRLVDAETAVATFPAVYDAARRRRHGMLSRPDAMWRHRLGHDPVDERDGASERFFAWLPDRGFVTYRLRAEWRDGNSVTELQLSDLVGVTPADERALWQFVLGVDLVETITARRRPVDDPLPHAVTNQSRVRVRPEEPFYVRLVDAPTALTRRSYAQDAGLRLRVHDAFADWNDGTWMLETGSDGARCERTHDAPDLELDATDLATVAFGGVRVSQLADAGRIVSHRDGAVETATRVLATVRAPWNPTGI